MSSMPTTVLQRMFVEHMSAKSKDKGLLYAGSASTTVTNCFTAFSLGEPCHSSLGRSVLHKLADYSRQMQTDRNGTSGNDMGTCVGPQKRLCAVHERQEHLIRSWTDDSNKLVDVIVKEGLYILHPRHFRLIMLKSIAHLMPIFMDDPSVDICTLVHCLVSPRRTDNELDTDLPEETALFMGDFESNFKRLAQQMGVNDPARTGIYVADDKWIQRVKSRVNNWIPWNSMSNGFAEYPLPDEFTPESVTSQLPHAALNGDVHFKYDDDNYSQVIDVICGRLCEKHGVYPSLVGLGGHLERIKDELRFEEVLNRWSRRMDQTELEGDTELDWRWSSNQSEAEPSKEPSIVPMNLDFTKAVSLQLNVGEDAVVTQKLTEMLKDGLPTVQTPRIDVLVQTVEKIFSCALENIKRNYDKDVPNVRNELKTRVEELSDVAISECFNGAIDAHEMNGSFEVEQFVVHPGDLANTYWPSFVSRLLSLRHCHPQDDAKLLHEARQHMTNIVWACCLDPDITNPRDYAKIDREESSRIDSNLSKKCALRDNLIARLEQDVDTLVLGFPSGATTAKERLEWLELQVLFDQMVQTCVQAPHAVRCDERADHCYTYNVDDKKKGTTESRLTAIMSEIFWRMKKSPPDAIGTWLDEALTDRTDRTPKVLKTLVDSWALRTNVSMRCIAFILQRSTRASMQMVDLLLGDGDDYKRWLEPTTTLFSLEQCRFCKYHPEYNTAGKNTRSQTTDARLVLDVMLALGLVALMTDKNTALNRKILKFSCGNDALSILDHLVKYMIAERTVEEAAIRSTAWLTLCRLLHPLPPEEAYMLLAQSMSRIQATACATEELASMAWMSCHRFTFSLAKPSKSQRPRHCHDLIKQSPNDLEKHRLRACIDDGQAALGKAAMVTCLANVSREIEGDELYEHFAIFYLGPGCLSSTTAPSAIREGVATLKKEVAISKDYSPTAHRSQHEPSCLVKAVHGSGILTFVNASSTEKKQTDRLKLLAFILDIESPSTTIWNKHFPKLTPNLKDSAISKANAKAAQEQADKDKAESRLKDFWTFLTPDSGYCAECEANTCRLLSHCLKVEEIAAWVTRPYFPELSYRRLLKQTKESIEKAIGATPRDCFLFDDDFDGKSLTRVDKYARTFVTFDGWHDEWHLENVNDAQHIYGAYCGSDGCWHLPVVKNVKGVQHYGVYCGLQRERLSRHCLYASPYMQRLIPEWRESFSDDVIDFGDPVQAWKPSRLPPCDGFWELPVEQVEGIDGHRTTRLPPLPYSVIAREWPFSAGWLDMGEKKEGFDVAKATPPEFNDIHWHVRSVNDHRDLSEVRSVNAHMLAQYRANVANL